MRDIVDDLRTGRGLTEADGWRDAWVHDVMQRAADEIERLRKLAGGERGGEGMKDTLQRLRDGIDAFENEMEQAWDRDARPDLWDHVIDVPVEDVRAIIRALAGGERGGETAIPSPETADTTNT